MFSNEEEQSTETLRDLRNRIKSQCDTFRHLGAGDSLTYNWVKHSTTTQTHLEPHELAPQFHAVKHTVLELVAESPSTEPATLQVLAHSASVKVRQAVADNPRTPIAALRSLASDIDPEVRYALAENHNIPRDVLDQLLDDDNPYVRDRAEKTLEKLGR